MASATTLHYELTDETTVTLLDEVTLYRIRATRDLPRHNVKAGDLGGFIQSTDNLSGEAWVSGNAQVFGDARVYGSARVSGNARVYDNAKVSDNAQVSGNAMLSGNSWAYDYAQVSGDAWVLDNAWVFDNARVSGKAWIYENAKVFGNALIFDKARVFGSSSVTDNAQVFGTARVRNFAYVCSDASIEKTSEIITGSFSTSIELDWTFHRTTNDHILHIGCESGTLEHHQELCNSPEWIATADPRTIAAARPEYQAVIDLCRARVARW